MDDATQAQVKTIAEETAKLLIQEAQANQEANGLVTTLPSKKPSIFRSKIDDIDEYLVVWENYARVKNIPQENRLASFRTHLDANAQEKLQIQELDNKSWSDAKLMIREILDNKLSAMEARQLMIDAVQEVKEAPVDFGFRLEKLSKKAYPENDATRTQNLSDCFIRGLNSDVAALKLLSSDSKGKTFTQQVAIAQEVHNATKIRKGRQEEQIFGVQAVNKASESANSSLKEQVDRLSNIVSSNEIKESQRQHKELTDLLKEQTSALNNLSINQVQLQQQQNQFEQHQRQSQQRFQHQQNYRGGKNKHKRNSRNCYFCGSPAHLRDKCPEYWKMMNSQVISYPGNSKPVHGYYNNSHFLQNPTYYVPVPQNQNQKPHLPGTEGQGSSNESWQAPIHNLEQSQSHADSSSGNLNYHRPSNQ